MNALCLEKDKVKIKFCTHLFNSPKVTYEMICLNKFNLFTCNLNCLTMSRNVISIDNEQFEVFRLINVGVDFHVTYDVIVHELCVYNLRYTLTSTPLAQNSSRVITPDNNINRFKVRFGVGRRHRGPHDILVFLKTVVELFQEVVSLLLKKCGSCLFALDNIHGSSLLLMDFIHAAAVVTLDTRASDEQVILLVSSFSFYLTLSS